MWNKKLFLIIALLFSTTPSFAHSGRLDGSGGHRVNKEWIYKGQYLEIKDNTPEIKEGKIIFNLGDYHFHCKPANNKIDLTTYRNGIYIPVLYNETKEVITSNIEISQENRVASKESNIYHKSNCQYIKNIKEQNIIIFEDKEDAEENDYISCKICKPEIIE